MLLKIKDRAKDVFAKRGYPSISDEMWKYTNTKNFIGCQHKSTNQSNHAINDLELPKGVYNIILFNGHVIAIDGSDKDIIINRYSDLVNSSDINNFLKLSNFSENGVVAHNTSEFSDVLHLTIRSSRKVNIPINIITITENLNSNNIIFPRIYIHAEQNSSAKIYIQNKDGGATCQINSVFEFFCEDSSHIEIIHSSDSKNQEIIDSMFFHQMDNSQIQFLSTTFGGKLYRSNINIELMGKGCNNNFGVLMLGDNNDHIDYHASINHLSGQSNSNFSCRSLLKSKSKGVFNGKIMVAEGASGTNSILNNNNLLLSDKTEMQSNPQLEINCEDVKCSHGSTSGNLDKEALFYLRSRGIPEEDARGILIEGFINKLISPYDIALLSLDKRIKNWI